MQPTFGVSLLAFLFLSLSTAATAADFCVEMVRRAVYDNYYSSYDGATYTSAQRTFCRQYEEAKQSSNSGGVDISVMRYFDLGFDWDNEKQKHFQELMCEKTQNFDASSTSVKSAVRSISPYVAGPLEQCAKAKNAGVQGGGDLTGNGDEMIVSIAYLQPLGGKESVTFTGPPYISRSLSCDRRSDLAQVRNGTELASGKQLSMTCHRTGPAPTTLLKGRRVVHEGGTVTLQTSAGYVIASIGKKLEDVPMKECAEKEDCEGEAVACLPKRWAHHPNEAAVGWYTSPSAPEYVDAPLKLAEPIKFDYWNNAECGEGGKGWHTFVGSCGQGGGSGSHNCEVVRVRPSSISPSAGR